MHTPHGHPHSSNKSYDGIKKIALSAALILTLQGGKRPESTVSQKTDSTHAKVHTLGEGTHNDPDVTAYTRTLPYIVDLEATFPQITQDADSLFEQMLQKYRLRDTILDTKPIMDTVDYIVLHSTEHLKNHLEDNVVRYLQKTGKIHFMVKRDGTIIQYLAMNHDKLVKIDHIGKESNTHSHAIWNENPNVTFNTIGIEVSAFPGQEWSQAQYNAVKDLVYYLGGKYGLQKKDVITHTMVAYSKEYGMMRKHDPAYVSRVKLGLPPSSVQINTSVVTGTIAPNLTDLYVRCRKKHVGSNPGLGLTHSQAITYLQNHYAGVDGAISLHKQRNNGCISPHAHRATNVESRLSINEIASQFASYSPSSHSTHRKKHTSHKARK